MNKVCSKCGTNVPNDSQFCTNCGSSEFKTIETPAQPAVAPVAAPTVAPAQPAAATQPPKKGMPTWLKVILIILLVLVLLVGGCTAGCVILTKSALDSATETLEDWESELDDWESELDDWESEYDYDSDYDTDDSETTVYGYNESFEFDDLEISIGKDYSFTVFDNQYSEYHGKDVVKVPVTVTNKSSSSHYLNMFYYDIYGPNGTELKNMATLFYFDNDDVLDYAGELLTGASYTKYFYFVYDGDGTYTFEFDNYSEEVKVEIEITK